MKLPVAYFEYSPSDFPTGRGEFHTLRGLRKWVQQNNPEEIEMTKHQFWLFAELQPLPYEEKYWTTFCGIPLRCREMTDQQQKNLRII